MVAMRNRWLHLIRKLWIRWLAVSLTMAACLVCLSWVVLESILASTPIDVARYIEIDPSPQLFDRQNRLLHVSLNANEEWSIPVDVSAHSPYVREATIAVEDQRFEHHRGVDFIAIVRAALQSFGDGRVSSGASTITMQLVKMVDQSPRSLRGKFEQMMTAMVLERHTTKDDILGAYLNRAAYGSNLIGVRAASMRYFGKSSDELTLSEAALLAGIPKSPARFDPLRHSAIAQVRRNFVLYRMHEEQVIDEDRLLVESEKPPSPKWHDFPALVPHLAEFQTTPIKSLTIDRDEQIRAQALLRKHVTRFQADITHGAVIVVDVESGDILARVGSPDFFNQRGGQIDMITKPRSPGSTLKPFIFAEALTHNQVYPSEIMLDDTLDYGQYSPANYDGNFNGLISATEALRFSLNIPSVMMLNRVGVDQFQERLRTLGITTLQKESDHYGLGLVLGNCEVRLDELAAAYVTLASVGVQRPLRLYRDSPPTTSERRVWSPGVATAMFDMMRQPLPKELHGGLVRADVPSPACWKTGTSTGHHDAWAFVFDRKYVVGIWMGNADGKRSDRLVGATAALPLAAEVFRNLPRTARSTWPSMAALKEVSVCSVSGLPIGKHCLTHKTARIPAEQFLNRSCTLHQKGREEGSIRSVWPADARHWDLANVELRREQVAIANNDNAPAKVLRITSPADNSEFRLSGVSGGDQVQLKSSLSDTTPLHWYCNNQYLGQSTRETPLYLTLRQGVQNVSCMSTAGQTDAISITVKPTT